MQGEPRGFRIHPAPVWTRSERRQLRRWLGAVAVDVPDAARRLRLGRGMLHVRTGDERLARDLAVLIGAVIGRQPFVYVLRREPGPEPREPSD